MLFFLIETHDEAVRQRRPLLPSGFMLRDFASVDPVLLERGPFTAVVISPLPACAGRSIQIVILPVLGSLDRGLQRQAAFS